MVKIITTKRKSALLKREEIEAHYRTKYYSLFINNYEFPTLNREQERFALSQLWEIGSVCLFIAEGTKPLETGYQDNPNGEIVLCPYAVDRRNIYNYPVDVNYVKLRGVGFIPSGIHTVNKDCVIMWGHTSHNSIRSFVEYYISKLADIEITINMALQNQKLPRLIATSVEDKERMTQLANDIENGVPRFFVDLNDIKNLNNVLQSGEYTIDRLYTYKVNIEKELMTFFGFDNAGIIKRERENVDETNANNEEIDNGGNCFIDEMRKGAELCEKILGYPLPVREKSPKVEMFTYEDKQDENMEEEETTNE